MHATHSPRDASARTGGTRFLTACARGFIACCLALGVSGAATAAPAISLNKASYAPDETIQVTFSGGPGNPKDWIGIYTDGITPSGNPQSLAVFVPFV
ncbi:MAG: hypothetical protein EOP85_14460 [Verrucomicrobiaceae bacterium]|nr:MAG: hypothetical protein EOP85_14460 [Verrucomicrobiaceae bacterium]